MSAEKDHIMLHSPFTFSSMSGKKVWPCVGSYIRACCYWCSLVLWLTSSRPQGKLFPLILGLPSSSHMEHCIACLCLLPCRRCLSVFSFSPFLVKVSSRGVHNVQDRWHRDGKRGSQSSSSNRNDGFTPAVLSQDSYKRQVLVTG